MESQPISIVGVSGKTNEMARPVMEHILGKEVSGMLQGVAIDECQRQAAAIMRGASLGYP